jgi:two-component system response regulator
VNDAYILLVEDRQEDIELTLRAFKKAHIVNEIVVKRDGVEALEFLESLAATGTRPAGEIPALILLDVSMPRMGGVALLENVRRLSHVRFVPVVMLTSSNEERDLVASYDRGANSYVRKPVTFADFAALIARLGMYWIVTNEVPAQSGQGSVELDRIDSVS